MRNFIDITNKGFLTEATKVKSPKSAFDIMPDLETGSRSVATTGRNGNLPSEMPRKTASGAKTRRKLAQAGGAAMNHPGAAEAMRNMMNHGMEDEISDADAARNAGLLGGRDADRLAGPDATGREVGFVGNDMDDNQEPVTNDNLPAIVNKEIAQAGGKVVSAWAFEGDCDPALLTSNDTQMEWPPRSGRMITIPEVDRGAWFPLDQAKKRILKSQSPFLDRLDALLHP